MDAVNIGSVISLNLFRCILFTVYGQFDVGPLDWITVPQMLDFIGFGPIIRHGKD